MYHVKPAEIFPSAIKEPLVQQTHQPNHKLVVSAMLVEHNYEERKLKYKLG